jgi:hypothetical protein
VRPDDFPETAQPRSRKFREQLLALAGVWSDLDADAMIDDVYRTRAGWPAMPFSGSAEAQEASRRAVGEQKPVSESMTSATAS